VTIHWSVVNSGGYYVAIDCFASQGQGKEMVIARFVVNYYVTLLYMPVGVDFKRFCQALNHRQLVRVWCY
jgi:hypothetical protein